MAERRNIPAVDYLLRTQKAAELIAAYGRPLTLSAFREILDEIRLHVSEENALIPERMEILQLAEVRLQQFTRSTLEPVINATGVILHTNLGRAPLSQTAQQAMSAVACGYSTLEFDLSNGKRGSRYTHVKDMLIRLTGAEDALVVNNNASAVLLALSALARRRRVLIARTQLVEIGGGFRIPDVMKHSGAKLVEVGTTNRVHLYDYQRALEEQPIVLVMRAHRSNFRIVGFHTEPNLSEMAALAHEMGRPVYDDLGSGTLLDTARFGLEHEPTIQETVSAGADLVSFSGDKLLGGPQAGILVGRADIIRRLKSHPLARAVRPDKFCLAALTATLTHYLKDEVEREIPIWQMIATPAEMIRARAEVWQQTLAAGELWQGNSTVGGGSLPGETLPTYLLALDVPHPQKMLAQLRKVHPAIIARVQGDHVVLDPRTVLPQQEGALLVGIQNALKLNH